MTNAYEKAQELGLTGTDQQIVLALRATGVTANPISLAYLMETLNFRGMLRKTDGQAGQERWVGTLQNLKAALVALGMTAEVSAYEMWFSHVTNPRQALWDTTQPAFAAGFWAMKQGFADAENMPSSEDFLAIAALGGGWQFWTLTLEEYQSQKASAIALAAKEAALDLVQNTAAEAAREECRKSDSTPESIVAAALAVLGGE
jgi:hypothetical protein